MRNWSREDWMVVEKADLDLKELQSWFKRLFGDSDDWSNFLPKEAKSWFWQEVETEYVKASSWKIRQNMLLKIRHTKDVVEAGWEIIRGEKEIDWNMGMVIIACFFHDIGRFQQALLGSFEDWETNYDHGDKGAKLIWQRNWSGFRQLGIDRDGVVEAIRRHNKYKAGTEDIYVKLVRDADKLALLRHMKFLLREVDCTNGGISETVISDYLAGGMVKNENVVTKNDTYLRWLSWENDFNFETTRRLFIKEEVKDWVFSEIGKSDPQAFSRLKKIFLLPMVVVGP